MTELEIRPANRGDAPGAHAVEARSLDTAWSERQIAEAAESGGKGTTGGVYFVALINGAVVGTISAVISPDDCEIMNLAVAPEYRRGGIAEALMKKAAEEAAKSGAKKIVLEVSEDNVPAERLYEKLGFKTVGRRKGFYRGRDALVKELLI